MEIKNRKKGDVGSNIFGFFFILLIFSVMFFFITYGIHFLLNDYALEPTENIAGSLLVANGSAMNNIYTLRSNYLENVLFYDIFFLLVIISAFVESTIGAIRAKERGFLSFFGLLTIGNLFFIFILVIATKIQGWMLNDVFYVIITTQLNTPFLSFFFNNSVIICVIWAIWLIAINQINIDNLKEKFRDRVSSRGSLVSSEGRFEE
jgi:hypothetical protein